MLSTHDHAERIAAAGRSRALRGQVPSAGIAAPASLRVWMSNPTAFVKATDPLGSTPSPPRPEEALST